MHAKVFVFFGFAMAAIVGPVNADETAGTLSQLQVVMQRHIDSQLIDGAIHQRDLENGKVVRYYPVETHSMVMAIGDDYILCTDLKTTDGNSVPVDIYVTRSNGTFRVFQTEIDNREPLEDLIRAKLVERIR